MTMNSSSSRTSQPDPQTVEILFRKCIGQMDLPPDKIKLLRDYPLEKKWEIIRDQDLVSAKNPPSHYINSMRNILASVTPARFNTLRRRAVVLKETTEKPLSGLEISLRTNNIRWVDEFLSSKNGGLDVLVAYLQYSLETMRVGESACDWASSSNSLGKKDSIKESMKKRSSVTRDQWQATCNDVHLCILCMKAIMNNQNGFNLVWQHPHALNYITGCLCHKNLRTKGLILELVAAVCLVEHGHDAVLSAFDSYRAEYKEKQRFQSLMNDFRNLENFSIDFMVSCMQFINIIVHSVQDMHFRVAMQYEFFCLALDDCLKKLQTMFSDAEQLQIQVQAYLDNCIDVGQLIDDSEAKNDALCRLEELEEKLGVASEKLQEAETEHVEAIACLKRQIQELRRKCEYPQMAKRSIELVNASFDILQQCDQSERSSSSSYDYASSFLCSGTDQHRDADASKRLNGCHSSVGDNTPDTQYDSCGSIYSVMIPNRASPVHNGCIPAGITAIGISQNTSTSNIIPAAPPLPSPPMPTLIPASDKGNGPVQPPPPHVPPPPPPLLLDTYGQFPLTIKRKIETKYRLPCLNWAVLKPQQVKGTVFCELNEDKYYAAIDFEKFEEMFRTGNGLPVDQANATSPQVRRKIRSSASLTLLDGQRQRNLAIARRKLNLPSSAIVKAINGLDLSVMSCENVEILQHFIPSESEVKAFQSFVEDGKDVRTLSKEDQFLYSLMKVERLSQKLAVMNFTGNFNDVQCIIQPQLKAVMAASTSIRKSEKLKQLLEIVLAFGNYMNSSKRGPVYGFRLQSLNTLLDIRSHDKRYTLLHFIVSTIAENFADLLNFHTEVRSIEKASTVSLENVQTDVAELSRGLEMVKREDAIRQELKASVEISTSIFLGESESKIEAIIKDAEMTQTEFLSCVQYYGETSKSQTTSSFFGSFAKFQKAFKQAQIELKMKFNRHVDQPLMEIKPSTNGKLNGKQEEMMQIEDKKPLKRTDVVEGTIESLLDDLKKTPYIRADALRRNRRKTREFHAGKDLPQ